MKRAVFCSLVLTLGCGGGTLTAPSETSSPTPGPTIPAANRALVDPVLSEMSVGSFLGCVRDLTATGVRSVAVYDNHQWRTDTNSFWSAGISGIWMLGNGDYPYANTAEDTLDKVDSVYGTRIARVSAAVALNLAEPTGRE